jgi:hypothetical protein
LDVLEPIRVDYNDICFDESFRDTHIVDTPTQLATVLKEPIWGGWEPALNHLCEWESVDFWTE